MTAILASGGVGSSNADKALATSSARTCLLILGMHRSGTSALAGTLAHLGCRMPKTLIGPNSSNEAGHWESMIIADLDDAILRSAGGHWADWRPLRPDWINSRAGVAFQRRARTILVDEFGASPLFVLKEPRICRIAGFWLSALEDAGIDAVAALPIRDPLEVAASLERRDGIPRPAGMLLWLRYVLEAESATRRLRRTFTSYDGLLDDWEGTIRPLSGALGLEWPERIEEARPGIEAFIDPRHRHHSDSLRNVPPGGLITAWVESAYAIFEQWIANGENPADHAALDELLQVFDHACPTLEQLAGAELETVGPARLVANLMAELERADEEISNMRANAARLGVEYRREIDELQAALGQALDDRQAAGRAADTAASRRLARRVRAAGRLCNAALVPHRLRTKLLRHMMRTSGLFDRTWYCRRYPDVAESGIDPMMHFVIYGLAEGRSFNGLLQSGD
jgi:hypothetical protein